ncbi:XdhC family protein [Flammeovirga aprica]|uniref:XshC-Cox1-family protein n=1 Tax=Flammeovirga aprica JL-4 TaxID=694437 RepID=A0A7X9RT93_9BACT|nr:XdhC/CoxI family protein [Flammeovirga aprica]NME68101.1 XshC-Cox1-family protein [Flammeovirga aprica JL-4]
MIHELREIVYSSYQAQQQQIKTVLVSVVGLNGSSYRKPGVRMLLWENHKMIGAISGGCVEKEMIRQAESVFKSGQSKVIEYDGRFRLGCEGVLQILLEPFCIHQEKLHAFQKALEGRKELKLESYFSEDPALMEKSYTQIFHQNLPLLPHKPSINTFFQKYQQILPPEFQLFIFGVEHDAKALCQMAALTGWNVQIIDTLKGTCDVTDFTGAKNLIRLNEDEIHKLPIDQHTAVVVMTHSFVKDLTYLLQLHDTQFAYLGVLGAKKRIGKLMEQMIEFNPTLNTEFLDAIHSPCGLDIGSITPHEISISIIAEIISVYRGKTPFSVSHKTLSNA